jgi:1-acyl-sn-glycerol-3-phosphate acyltransferase
MPFPPSVARLLSSAFGGPAVRDRASRLAFPDAGHGFDSFGLHPDFCALGETMAAPLYDRYFRVESVGHENIPSSGAAVIASNHSGTLPFDGMMIWTDCIRNTNPPRVPRAIADYFVPSLPMISTLFARCGVVGGSRGNARTLLEEGEMLLIFPEGTPGIIKRWQDRYKLQEWRQGHCEMAIRHRAPVIPIAVVGAEEQMPQVARIPLKGPLPYLPITATLFPLPVKYHLYWGAPIPLDKEFTAADADDPAIVRQAALRVKAAVQELIDRGLRERKGIFR